jgi:hypothetical protein
MGRGQWVAGKMPVPQHNKAVRRTVASFRRRSRGQDAGATTQQGRVWDPPLPRPAPCSIRHRCGAAGKGAAALRPLRFQPVTAPGFGIFSDSLAMSRQGGLRTRPYPDPTIRHSVFAIRPSPRGMGRGQWVAGKMPARQHNQGGSGTRPYGFAPFSIRYPCGAAGKGAAPLRPYDSSRLQRPGLESSPTASPCRGRVG